MDKNRKRWGYIFDEKLDMLIPNIPRQKKFVKIFLIYSAGSVFFLLFLSIVLNLPRLKSQGSKIFKNI